MTTVAQRRELAEFLRSRRERRSPQDVGLPPAGGRRKTPGLRREEVATLAGLSVTWYTWLEQAREIRASRQVLGCLVDVLGLDEVETAHLFALAGEVPPENAVRLNEPLPDQYRQLLVQLEPYPAYIVNRRLDVLAWNRGCAALYADLPGFRADRRNILWLTFTSEATRRISQDWERDAAHTIALFRAQAGGRVLEPEFAGLISALERESEEFSRLWRRKELAAFVPSGFEVNHPSLGRVVFDSLKMHTADADKTLVALIAPTDSELSRRLGELITVC
jgi:hypothetical protein